MEMAHVFRIRLGTVTEMSDFFVFVDLVRPLWLLHAVWKLWLVALSL